MPKIYKAIMLEDLVSHTKNTISIKKDSEVQCIDYGNSFCDGKKMYIVKYNNHKFTCKEDKLKILD